MATDSGTAERTVARQLANGVCRSRIRGYVQRPAALTEPNQSNSLDNG